MTRTRPCPQWSKSPTCLRKDWQPLMNEQNLSLSPKLERALTDYYTTPQPAPDFADCLEQNLLAQFSASTAHPRTGQPANRNTPEPQRGSTFMQTLRTYPALVWLLAILALALLTGAAYALGQFSGYLPGLGFVQGKNGEVLTLSEPAQLRGDTFTLRVLQAVSDERTFSLTVEQKGQPPLPVLQAEPFASIILPGGQALEFRQSYGSREQDNLLITVFEFSPLPPQTRQVVLRYELQDAGNSLWQVELPFGLRPLQADEVIPPPAGEAWQPITSESQAGLRLVLQNVATASDKTVLQVALRFDHPGGALHGEWGVLLKDEKGRVYPLSLLTSDTDNLVKTYETRAFQGGEMLTLSLISFPDSAHLPLSQGFEEEAQAFLFDPGPDAQVGQSWRLDKTLSAGEFSLKIVQATLVAPGVLELRTQSAVPVTAVFFSSEKSRRAAINPTEQDGSLISTLFFDPLPKEPFTIFLTRVYYPAQGEWNIHWLASAVSSEIQVGNTATLPPAPPLSVSPTPAFSDPAWVELVQLTESFDSSFQQGPGWIHYRTQTNTYPAAGQTFLPPLIFTEQWLEIDPQGYVLRSLYTDSDSQGNLLQQSATIGNYTINFSTGETGDTGGEPYHFSTSTLRQDFNSALTSGARVTIEKSACDQPSPCFLITFWETFGAPLQNPGETQAFSGLAHQVLLSPEGQTLKTSAFWRMEDGTERMDFVQTLFTLEKLPAPPAEVLQVLENIVLP